MEIKHAIFGLIIFLLTALVITGCQPTTINENSDVKTLTFSSTEEYQAFVKLHENTYGSYYRGGGLLDNIDVSLIKAETSADSGASAGASNEYSETNNQVAGIDEADIIKTDGEYIYTISGNTLFIVKAYPGEDAEVVLKKTFNESSISNLFVSGDKLVIMGTANNINEFDKLGIIPSRGMSFLQIYDISDKEHPSLDKDYKFEGYYFESRMKNDKIYFLSTIYPEYRDVYPLPIIMEDSVVKEMPVRNIHYFNIHYNNPVLININKIDLSDYTLDSTSLTVEGSETFYMSDENMFLTSTEYVNEWEITQDATIDVMLSKLTESEKEQVRKIRATDSDVLSDSEKQSKILQIVSEHIQYMSSSDQDAVQDQIMNETKNRLMQYEHMEYTIINKVSLDLEVVANGKVPGHIMNQFSLDEYDDVLRIGTTINARWSSFTIDEIPEIDSKSTNNVYTLDENLDIIGKLEGLAPGETIYSTRFVQDRLYMVTFRQVDPFFVIDLSNPAEIKNLGELKIPGFSRYLHPYDENTIIGLGRSATEEGRTEGIKISLFDVTDVANPKEIANFVTDEKYAQTTAEYEHKAFLFSKEKNLLVIPVNYYDYQNQGNSYNGALVFNITRSNIELKGLIDHSTTETGNNFWYYNPGVERSLYINDLLYTKSTSLLRINKLSDLSSVKNVTLETDYTGPYPVY